MSQPIALHLEKAKPLVAHALQVQGPVRLGAGRRDANFEESISLTISALGSVGRWVGVKWVNLKDDKDKPVAVVLIPGLSFEEGSGHTTLSADTEKTTRQKVTE